MAKFKTQRAFLSTLHHVSECVDSTLRNSDCNVAEGIKNSLFTIHQKIVSADSNFTLDFGQELVDARLNEAFDELDRIGWRIGSGAPIPFELECLLKAMFAIMLNNKGAFTEA